MIFDLLSICNDTHYCNGKRIEDVLQECGDITWRVSHCEELVGVTHRR